jgi:hypothetical protein
MISLDLFLVNFYIFIGIQQEDIALPAGIDSI